MSRAQTVEGVEAEAARVRTQLLSVGSDLRRRVDPTILADQAKASLHERVDAMPTFVKKQSSPIALVVAGVALGSVVTSVFAGPRGSAGQPTSPTGGGARAKPAAVAKPSFRAQVKAALLSFLGIGLGWLAGGLIPVTPAEESYLAEPKAILREHIDEFLAANVDAMKMSAMNMFGASRLSATALIGLAILAQVLAAPPRKASRPAA